MAQQLHLTKLLWIALICVPILVCMCIWASKPRSTENLSINELVSSDYFGRTSGANLERNNWLVSELTNLKERPLKELGENALAYRFIWLRSFQPPLVVTAYFPDKGENVLCSKTLVSEPKHSEKEPLRRNIVKETNITLTAEQSAKIRESLDASRFFSLNCYDEYTRPPLINFEFAGRTYRYFHGEGPSMKDGAFWVLEGYDHGSYRVLVRQSPGEDEVKQLATMLMKEAKLLPADTREIY
ncbi:MAG: hypothetical protein J0M35_20105 [Candidatus Obscuribacter phosphatis]|uniref:Uncharacterized protein n=1 Tax=Candidatus Obscuribacter phosphatis TaxID=1906157 RepID=A0A8J7PJU3_9BACT|nr:hypothetical protein [Candidatus Obscuribacter phosphatis]